MRKIMFGLACGLVLAATPALAWKEYKSSDSYSSENAHYIQCNNGDKWEIRVRKSDGAAHAQGGTPGYNYTSLSAAAAAVCKE